MSRVATCSAGALYGAQSSVLIGVTVVAIATTLAVSVGSISGYASGWVDTAIQRFVDIWLLFPGLIFVILVVAIFGNNNVVFGAHAELAAVGWLVTHYSRRDHRRAQSGVRRGGQVARRAPGSDSAPARVAESHGRHHRQCLDPHGRSRAAVLDAVLPGLRSARPPFPAWGGCCRSPQTQLQYHPNLAIFPGLAIVLTVYAFNMLGDALRDVLDPRLRHIR